MQKNSRWWLIDISDLDCHIRDGCKGVEFSSSRHSVVGRIQNDEILLLLLEVELF